ncbi:MAG: hypothetical protein H6729_14270 [Deltaproteobacteria bacterium]|nr:hypothetical protein [Deltaproteobacteria bacterium]
MFRLSRFGFGFGLVVFGWISACGPSGGPSLVSELAAPNQGDASARISNSLTISNGLSLNGLGPNGLELNGLPLNGLYVNGLPLNGLPLNGLYVNGLYVNGLPVNGVQLNGLYVNGLPVNGLYVNGLPVNGLPLNGLYVNGLYVNGLPVNGANESMVLGLLEGLAACALNSTQNLAVTDLNNSTHVYDGVYGLDPAWSTTASSLSKSTAVAQCMIDHYGASFDPSLNVSNFKLVMQYLVECALPAGASVTVTDADETDIVFSGALGLAPEWATGAPTIRGQELVSACLGARTNAMGTHVQLSLRGGDISVSSLERQQYRRYEGAFWGNLFSATPTMNVCEVDGGGMAGRLCTEGANCGFTYHASCPTACSAPDASGTYTNCGGSTNTLSTYLAFASIMASSGKDSVVCTRLGDTSARCWGHNQDAMLALGLDENFAYRVPMTPLEAPGVPLERVMSIHIGGTHACARLQDGTNRCWGKNEYGQIGDGGSYGPGDVRMYAAASNGIDVASLTAGFLSNCYVRADGTVWCWGHNFSGTLADGTTDDSSEPVQALTGPGTPLTGVAKVVIGDGHACALRIDGSLWCWGANMYGAVGVDVANTKILFATQVSVVPLIDVAAGGETTCGLDESGTVWCWGLNMSGVLGDGTTNWRSTPQPVSALPHPATSIAVGAALACARLNDATAWCWGVNWYGQCGNGTSQNDQHLPVQVLTEPSRPLDNVEQVSISASSVFARLENGLLYGWGLNNVGQLGLGTADSIAHPYAVKVTNSTCGDAVCNYGETESSCLADCPLAPEVPPECVPSEEILDGIDNDCDGVIDQGLNLLQNPTFATDLGHWTISGGSMARVTKNCLTKGCAEVTTTSIASMTEANGAVGLGTYVAKVWIRAKARNSSAQAYIELEERTASGTLVGIKQGNQVVTNNTYAQVSATRAVSSPTNTIKMKIVDVTGETFIVDDVSLVRQ